MYKRLTDKKKLILNTAVVKEEHITMI